MSTGRWREGRRAWKRLGPWHDDRVTGPGSRDREPDPLVALGDIGSVRRLLDEVELRAVRSARLRGRSWAEVATRLGVTRQAAWERWRDVDGDGDGDIEINAGAGAAPPTLDEAAAEIARLGPADHVTVPNVVGATLAVALRVLAEHHLRAVGPELDDLSRSDAPGAVVARQRPESGTEVSPRTRVTLWIDGGEGGVREPRRPRPEPLLAHKPTPQRLDDASEIEAVG